jgi:PAS domain S-box-containing protein
VPDSSQSGSSQPGASARWPLKDRALDAAAEGITISDLSLPDNPLIYVNTGFERLTGYPAEEVLGRNCRFLQGTDTDPATAETIRRAIHEERECTVEILNYRRDGTTFWNRLSLTPVRDDSGKVTNYIGVQSDVTARREAEEALREANRRIRADLEAGARIQQALLPKSPPESPGADIRWRFLPCEELAGDIFNVFALDERRIVVYLLDVTGHGVPAALLSVTLSRFLGPAARSDASAAQGREAAPLLEDPLQVVNWLNRKFPFDPETSQFFTILYGVLDVAAGEFRYVSAGHPPIVHTGSAGRPRILEAPAFPVGVEPAVDYRQRSVRLAEGERLFLYTDGLVEARDPAGAQFGPERLLAALARPAEPLDAILTETMDAVRRWAGPRGLEDDASILAVELTGRQR